MPRTVPEMPDSKIRSLRHKVVNGIPKTNKKAVGGVAGLKLICEPPKGDAKIGSRYWVLFYSFNGDRREKNYGSYPTNTSANVKELARELRHKLAQGIDPREEEREKAKLSKRKQKYQIPFSVAAENWRDFQIALPNRTSQDYQKKFNAVERYMFPILGNRPIGDIEYEEGLEALRTIWEEKPKYLSLERQLRRKPSARYRNSHNKKPPCFGLQRNVLVRTKTNATRVSSG